MKCVLGITAFCVFAVVQLDAAPGSAAKAAPGKSGVAVNVAEHADVNLEHAKATKRRQVPDSDKDELGKYVGLYNPDCSDTYLVTPDKTEQEIEPEKSFLKDGATTCHWNVIGTDNCYPTLACKKFVLADPTGEGDNACETEYLEVTDGTKGYKKYCGAEGPEEVTTGSKARELYLTLKLSDADTSRALKCTVTCNPGSPVGDPLPENSEPEVDEDCNCGRKPNADRIVGGEDAKKGEFPWMAALVAAGTRKPYCGASIINNKFILTAAHCFKGPYLKAENINVILNAHNMELTSASVASGQGGSDGDHTPEELAELDEKDNSHRYAIEKYYIHPLYVRQTNDFDVALLKLDRPIDFGSIKEVTPACLPKMDQWEESKEGAKAVISGFGLNDSSAATSMSILQKLDVNVFTDPECVEFYEDRYTKRMLCAGYREGGKDSCKGDSGGPLVSEKSKQVWEQIGIVSFGEGCAVAGKPGVYINTRQVSQWIYYMSNLDEAKWCAGN